jgi:ketosteroid isomerase-like protein
VPRTAADCARALVDGVADEDWSGLPALYSDDAVVDQPLQLPDPVRLRGRAEIARHFQAAAGLPLRLSARNVRIRETSDPDVVVVEFDYDGRNLETGVDFTFANIFVVQVREGQIVHTRDYSNHAVIAAAFGRLTDASAELQRRFTR